MKCASGLRNLRGARLRCCAPASPIDLEHLEATFVICSSDGFVENFGAGLMSRIARDAPDVRLCFTPKIDRSSTGLRDGSIDLDTGVVNDATDPEVRAQSLFDDHFIGVVRHDHALTMVPVTADLYAAQDHVRRPIGRGEQTAIDEALAAVGLKRRVKAVVTGFAAALALVRGSDFVAAVPERHTRTMRDGLFSFPLPIPRPEVTVCMCWHPRRQADPGHQWLRACVREVCAAV